MIEIDGSSALCDLDVANTNQKIFVKVRIYVKSANIIRLVLVLHRYWTDFNIF